ncbi:MAG TPA: RNA 2',3'-cyclic phosphodiesterase [Pyrinomonadaceae bacterium]|nr:RNA 2',3'-cyclic phosphodiesterase [Pyrinomonadaceae bacterium]
MTTYRIFIAIEIPSSIRRLLTDYIEQLRGEFPETRASWSREDNLHLTLKFLGDVPVTRIPDLAAACTDAAGTLGPFELAISTTGTFPPHGKPKVLWVGVGDAQPVPASRQNLSSLQASLESACAAHGFAREERTYHPHLTIARLREAKKSRALAERHRQLVVGPRNFQVSEIVLFRSELSSRGSKHTALSRHELAAAVS